LGQNGRRETRYTGGTTTVESWRWAGGGEWWCFPHRQWCVRERSIFLVVLNLLVFLLFLVLFILLFFLFFFFLL
jgi:hypothetical protein